MGVFVTSRGTVGASVPWWLLLFVFPLILFGLGLYYGTVGLIYLIRLAVEIYRDYKASRH